MITNQQRTPLELEEVDPMRWPEYHLAATFTTTMREILLNPERPRLEQSALLRDDTNSTLGVDFNFRDELRIELYPAYEDTPETLLVVDTLENEGSNKPGRALAEFGVNRLCHDRHTDEDRLVFSILQRMVRPLFEWPFPYDFGAGESENAIYRGQAPDTYLIDLYEAIDGFPFLVSEIPLRLRLTLSRDANGRLTTGMLERIGEIPTDPVFEQDLRRLFIVPPVLPGVEMWDENDPRVVTIEFPEGFTQPVEIDFAALLEGTTWNPARF